MRKATTCIDAYRSVGLCVCVNLYTHKFYWMIAIFQLSPTFTKSILFFISLRAYQSQFPVDIAKYSLGKELDIDIWGLLKKTTSVTALLGIVL